MIEEKMIRNMWGNRRTIITALLAGLILVVLLVPASARAQISKPYIAVFTGQSQGNFSIGYEDADKLGWRGLKAAEVGFEIFGLTISPGFVNIDNVQWHSSEGNFTYNLQYSAVYLNLGAREEFGLYFAGGLNFTNWEVLPQSYYLEETMVANGDIGFQAYLGFIVSVKVIPLKILLEAGYAQFNGDVSSTAPGTPPAFNKISSAGPIVRVGLALGW